MEKAASLSMRPSLSDSPQFSHSLQTPGFSRCRISEPTEMSNPISILIFARNRPFREQAGKIVGVYRVAQEERVYLVAQEERPGHMEDCRSRGCVRAGLLLHTGPGAT